MYMHGMDMDFDKMFPVMPQCIRDEERYIADYNYFKRMYPAKLRLVASIIENYLDRFEYEGSPIYMEYPDQVSIYRMACQIYDMFNHQQKKQEDENNKDAYSKEEIAKFKDIIQIMICQEIYIRRCRRDRYLRRFYRP